MKARRSAALAAILAVLVAACSSGGPGATPGGPASSNAAKPTNAPGDTSQPEPGGTSGSTGEDSGATIRVVNAWGAADGVGPSVELRTSGSDGVTLATIAPGEISDFVAVPKAKFGDGVERLTIVEAGSAPATSGLGPGEMQPTDRVTAIVYGYPAQNEILMGIDSVWEAGEAFYGLPWPEDAPASDATLAVYPGPLQYLEDEGSTLTLATGDGECLVDSTFGDPRNGFGGNGVTYLYVPGETRELRVTFDMANCDDVAADADRITIDAAAGDRILLVPWAPSGEVEFLVLDPSGG